MGRWKRRTRKGGMLDKNAPSPDDSTMLASHALLTLTERLPAAAATRLQSVDPNPGAGFSLPSRSFSTSSNSSSRLLAEDTDGNALSFDSALSDDEFVYTESIEPWRVDRY